MIPDKYKPYFYLLLLFVLTGGMFDNVFNIIATVFLAPFVLLAPAYMFKKKESRLLSLGILLCFVVLLISFLQADSLVLQGRLFGGAAIDNTVSFTVKTLIKMFLLFVYFPVPQKILLKFSNLCYLTSKIIVCQISISTILYNVFGLNKSIVNNLYPIISGFTWHESFPFVFMAKIFPFMQDFQYCRPLSIFREPGPMGIFLLFLFIIYSIIQRRVSKRYYLLTFLGLIVGLSKAALILAFLFALAYSFAKIIRSRAIAIIILSGLFVAIAQYVIYYGGGYFAHRSMGAMNLIGAISLAPKGFNASNEFAGASFGVEANLGFISMVYDLGVILSVLVYLSMLYLLVRTCVQKSSSFAVDLAVFAFFLGTLGLGNMYFSGLFLLTVYLFVVNSGGSQLRMEGSIKNQRLQP